MIAHLLVVAVGVWSIAGDATVARISTSAAVQSQTALPAQAPPAQVDPFLSRVAQAAQLLESDPQAAIETLDHLAVESIELRKTRPPTTAERPAHRQLFILRARAHLQLMNNAKAEESLRELLRVDPFFAGGLAPREQETLDGIRTRESGILEVSSTVRDCTILLDGVEIGVTGDLPIRVSLVAGTYQLRLEKPGYQGAGARVTMVPAQTLTVNDMAPKARIPPIAFVTDRPGVEVIVDNAPAGDTVTLTELRGRLSTEEAAALEQAVALARFDPGTSAGIVIRNPPVDRSLSVRFRGDCLIEETRTVAITADALAGLDAASPLLWFGDSSAIRMRPDVGTLRVNSVPRDADVYVDGQLSGRTPFERNVCTGEHRVRVRHRIGSYVVTAAITRGRSEVIEVTLRPGLAFLGALETVSGTLRPAAEIAAALDRVLTTSVSSFRLAAPVDLPPEVQRWSDITNAELVAAADRGDRDKVKRLLRQATDNFDAPLLLSAVARGPAGSDSPVDVLLFWVDHDGVDRVRLSRLTNESITESLSPIDRPVDPYELVYQNDLGIRVADSSVVEAPLVVVSVGAGSPGAIAGVKSGDSILTVEGASASAAHVSALVRQKRPGDIVTVSVVGASGPARQVALPVQRRARRAPAFSPAMFGNALTAKLQAALATASNPGDRDLLTLNLALVQMRFGQWRAALDLLAGLGQVPAGTGVGPGAVLYFRARCHQELGERDRATSLLREAATIDAEVLSEDGITVGAVVRMRLGTTFEVSRPPVR